MNPVSITRLRLGTLKKLQALQHLLQCFAIFVQLFQQKFSHHWGTFQFTQRRHSFEPGWSTGQRSNIQSGYLAKQRQNRVNEAMTQEVGGTCLGRTSTQVSKSWNTSEKSSEEQITENRFFFQFLMCTSCKENRLLVFMQFLTQADDQTFDLQRPSWTQTAEYHLNTSPVYIQVCLQNSAQLIKFYD